MANTIRLKRSATAGAVPTTAQLSLGELAINTRDGKMYLKKNDGGDPAVETIVQIGGSVTIASAPPAGAGIGDIYWDEDDGQAYIRYDDGNGAAQWVPLTPVAEAIIPGSEVRKLDDISAGFDGIETVFSLTISTAAHTPAYQNGVFVSVGGVIQEPETDFTITGDQITFTTAPASGLSFFAIDIGVVNPIGTPSDATVTPAKLSAGGPSWDTSNNLTIADQGDIRWSEASANGTNWVAFQAPATLAANVTWTLPAADTATAGFALTSDGAGQLSWGRAGGASGLGTNAVFYENDQNVTGSYTITSNKNAMSAGPITIDSGVTVTVPSGSVWVIV